MDGDAIYPGTEGPVAEHFHRPRIRLPSLFGAGGKRFRRHDRTAQGVCNRRRLNDAERAVETVKPELAHRDVCDTAKTHVRTWVHVIRFNRQPKAMLVAQFLQMLRVIFDDQLLGRLPEVPNKAFGYFEALDDAAG